MPFPLKKIQPALKFAASHLDEDLSLDTLASAAGLSPFHLHRTFSAIAGESPKQFISRLRLGRGAVLLLSTPDSVLDISLACGFASHEAFTRAFRRHFGMTPKAYRARGFARPAGTSYIDKHVKVVESTGPCIGLYHISEKGRYDQNTMSYSISKKELAPQPVLVQKRRIARADIAKTISECLGVVFPYAIQNAIPLAGPPFARYSDPGYGMLTIEPGVAVAFHPEVPPDTGILTETLPGGPAATTVHMGMYDKLPEAYVAMEQWMTAEGLKPAGAPWEIYVTDPGEYPDPKDWKTEIYWPVHT